MSALYDYFCKTRNGDPAGALPGGGRGGTKELLLFQMLFNIKNLFKGQTTNLFEIQPQTQYLFRPWNQPLDLVKR